MAWRELSEDKWNGVFTGTRHELSDSAPIRDTCSQMHARLMAPHTFRAVEKFAFLLFSIISARHIHHKREQTRINTVFQWFNRSSQCEFAIFLIIKTRKNHPHGGSSTREYCIVMRWMSSAFAGIPWAVIAWGKRGGGRGGWGGARGVKRKGRGYGGGEGDK